MSPFSLIVPAAGRSVRFGGPRSKLLEPLAGRAVIARAIDAFAVRGDVAGIVIATCDRAAIERAIVPDPAASPDPRLRFCEGGASRADSVALALAQVPEEVEWVAVHDGARPLVSQAVIERTLAAAFEHGAAVPALSVGLTIREAHGPLPARALRSLPRHTLFAMQTPQIMRRSALAAAIASCPVPLEHVTDDAQLLELAGHEVWLVEGDERNLKITTPQDLLLAQSLFERFSPPPTLPRTPEPR